MKDELNIFNLVDNAKSNATRSENNTILFDSTKNAKKYLIKLLKIFYPLI